jgi:hypothetical protein
VVVSDDNYLLKMHEDFDFLAEVQPLVDALKIPEDKVMTMMMMIIMIMIMIMMIIIMT